METRRIDLQLFAGEPTDPPVDPPKEDPPVDLPKTFTQEEVKAMMAKEKSQGRNQILKDLGLGEDLKSTKEALAKYQEFVNSQKTEAEKLAENLKTESEAKTSAEKKAQMLERKFEVVAAGAPASTADDIVVLVSSKVNDEKDFKTALEEVKQTYPNMFEETVDTGTGNNVGSKRLKTDGVGSLGKKLAESSPSKQSTTTNPYFV